MKTRLYSIFFFAALMAAMLGIGLPAQAQSRTLDPASLLNPDGTLDLTSNPHGVFDLRGWDVTLDTQRGPVLTPSASASAAPDASAWTPLANDGLNYWVYALAVSGSDLYVGGEFTMTSDSGVTLNRIAKYSSGVWLPLANNGLNGPVRALAVSGSDLYVGGYFTQTGNEAVRNLNNIAKYNGSAWSALANNGLDTAVYALVVSGSDLYVGGHFTQTADGTVKDLNFIAKYSGSAWSALARKGLNGEVYALATSGSDLYVGGIFTETGDGTMTLRRIAKYSSGVWSPFANGGLDHIVYAIAISGSDVYVGGWFAKTADDSVTNLWFIAKYSGGAWSALPHDGLHDEVYALAVSGSDLYVGGRFTQTADLEVQNLNYIARLPGLTPGPTVYVATFRSAGARDGWILESSETSNKGGTLNSAATTFRLGDDAGKRQYRAILSFNTASLPDDAVITKVTLKVKRQGVTGGGDPVNVFRGFLADVKKGRFGTPALQAGDFQAAANKTVGPRKPALAGGWYSLDLTGAGVFVNRLASNGGLTQIRLRFKLDDDNNRKANYLRLFSGNAPAASRPQLIVEYDVA